MLEQFWFFGFLVFWFFGSLVFWFFGCLVLLWRGLYFKKTQKNQTTKKPKNQKTKEPKNQKTKKPKNQNCSSILRGALVFWFFGFGRRVVLHGHVRRVQTRYPGKSRLIPNTKMNTPKIIYIHICINVNASMKILPSIIILLLTLM